MLEYDENTPLETLEDIIEMFERVIGGRKLLKEKNVYTLYRKKRRSMGMEG